MARPPLATTVRAGAPAGPGGVRVPPAPLALALALALLIVPLPAAAQDSPRQTLKRVEEEIQADRARQRQLDRQSQSIQREIAELRDRLVQLAGQARTQEEELDRLEESLSALEEEERERSARLEEERQQIATLLAALQRLSRVPPEAVIARPEGPVDTLRSALLLRQTVPAVRERADALAASLTALAETREQLQAQRTRTLSARVALDERQEEIGRLVARREALSRQTDEERQEVGQRMGRLTSQATDLRQLMERIEQERRAAAAAAARRESERLEAERREAERVAAERLAAAQRAAAERQAAERAEAARAEAARAEAERRLAEQRAADRRSQVATVQRAPDPPTEAVGSGGLRLPVGGRVTLRYGEADRFGAASRGITIAARPGSPVVAPFSGSVMFAGPFRGYGQILIVEHSNGYHSLIAGLGRIDTAVGKRVATGEPIGLMPSPTDGNPDLYFELRRHGQPINPQRGFGATEGKGQG